MDLRRAIAPIVLALLVLVVPVRSCMYVPVLNFKCLQSGFGVPSTMLDGLIVLDIPFLNAKAFSQNIPLSTICFESFVWHRVFCASYLLLCCSN